METREQIRWLKEKIKALAVTQRKNKLARKTKTIDPVLKKSLLAELGIKYPEWAHAHVVARKAEITAHLNVYLELRGKACRHNAPEDSYLRGKYDDVMNELRGKLAEMAKA